VSIILIIKSQYSAELRETLSQLPSQKDYIDAVGAIARLQEVYKDEADFTRPQANNTIDVLTGYSPTRTLLTLLR